MQQDPMRSRQLMRTELTARVAGAKEPGELEEIINRKLQELQGAGYQTTGVQVVGDKVLLLGSRIQGPAQSPSVPGSPDMFATAPQTVEITYAYVQDGESKQQKCASLLDALQSAKRHIDDSSAQPLSIHVASLTSYEFADIMAMLPRL